jgi:hypothetical protein
MNYLRSHLTAPSACRATGAQRVDPRGSPRQVHARAAALPSFLVLTLSCSRPPRQWRPLRAVARDRGFAWPLTAAHPTGIGT